MPQPLYKICAYFSSLNDSQSLLDGTLYLDGRSGVKDTLKSFLRRRLWETESHEGCKRFLIDIVDHTSGQTVLYG